MKVYLKAPFWMAERLWKMNVVLIGRSLQGENATKGQISYQIQIDKRKKKKNR